jgi:hypothetical protein
VGHVSGIVDGIVFPESSPVMTGEVLHAGRRPDRRPLTRRGSGRWMGLLLVELRTRAPADGAGRSRRLDRGPDRGRHCGRAGRLAPGRPQAARGAAGWKEASTMGRSEMIFIVKPRGSEIPAAREA